jgi:hypothetical protein
MSALTPKADIGTEPRNVRFVPEADIQQPGLGARYRQYWHHLHGFSRKNREVRMLLEQLGGGVMRLIAYVFDAALANLFGLAERPAHTNDCIVMLFDPRFPGRDPLLHLCVSGFVGKSVPG